MTRGSPRARQVCWSSAETRGRTGPGVGHWFTKVEEYIRYIMIRIDPDKVTPTKDESKLEVDLTGR